MELFGVDDRPQEGAEVVFGALGEAVLGHDVGIRLGYVEKIVVGGFGDLLDAVIGEGSGLSVDCIVRQPVLGEAVGNGCAPLCDPLARICGRKRTRKKQISTKTELANTRQYKGERLPIRRCTP